MRILRLAAVVAIGVAVIVVPVMMNTAVSGSTVHGSVERFFWIGGVGGVLAGVVGRGWRDWLIFLAAIFTTAIIQAVVVVYNAPPLEQFLGATLMFGLVAAPASIGYGLVTSVARLVRQRD